MRSLRIWFNGIPFVPLHHEHHGKDTDDNEYCQASGLGSYPGSCHQAIRRRDAHTQFFIQGSGAKNSGYLSVQRTIQFLRLYKAVIKITGWVSGSVVLVTPGLFYGLGFRG